MIARETVPPYALRQLGTACVCMLDTSVVVGVLRRHPHALGLLAWLGSSGADPGLSGNGCHGWARGVVPILSAVVRYEAERGVRSPEGQVRLGALLASTRVVPLTAADAGAAARIDRALRAAREPIGELDVLIAGAAVARGLPLLTYNVRHFARVAGLEVWNAGTARG